MLEQLITSKFESALEEVAGRGGTEASPDGAGALVGDDLAEASNQASVVGYRIQLYPCLDSIRTVSLASMVEYVGKGCLHIDRCETTMGNRAADCAGQSEPRVELETAELCGGRRAGILNDGIELCRACRRWRG